MIIATIILLIISFYAKGRMDLSGADLFKWENNWKNRSESWAKKYSRKLEPSPYLWYYLFLYKPKYKERFPYSTTALVWLTDYWHFTQFIFLNCLFIAFAINTTHPIYYFIGIRIIYAITFNLSNKL